MGAEEEGGKGEGGLAALASAAAALQGRPQAREASRGGGSRPAGSSASVSQGLSNPASQVSTMLCCARCAVRAVLCCVRCATLAALKPS